MGSFYAYAGKGTNYNGILNYLRSKGLVSDKGSLEVMATVSDYITEYLESRRIKFKRPRHKGDAINLHRDWVNAMLVQSSFSDFKEFIANYGAPIIYKPLRELLTSPTPSNAFRLHDRYDRVFVPYPMIEQRKDSKVLCTMCEIYHSGARKGQLTGKNEKKAINLNRIARAFNITAEFDLKNIHDDSRGNIEQ